MPDKVKEILDKIKAWWNKFTTKQKTIIITAAAAVIFTFAILIYVFTKPQYIAWEEYSSTAEAAEVIEILESNGIAYQTSNDGCRMMLQAEDMAVANLALGAEGFMPTAYTIEDAISGGF